MLMQAAPSGLFDRIASWDNLVAAYHAARRGKPKSDVAACYGAHLEEETIILQGSLKSGEWEPGRPRIFRVNDPKPRLITAPPFADRVVHHALVRQIEPLFERRFIVHSYACRRGRGVQKAVATLQKMIRIEQRNHGRAYVLKADIARYFASIDQARLLAIAGREIGCPRTVGLLKAILGGYGFAGGIGLPVGALTSQLMANVYLDQLDHFAKDRLGVRWYLRYMDDFAIVCHDKAQLWGLSDAIADMLATKLGLRLNRKTTIIRATDGVDFCGYRIHPTHVVPRKRTVRRVRRGLQASAARVAAGADIERELAPRLASALGWLKHCDAARTRASLLAALQAVTDIGEIDVRKRWRDRRRAACRARKGR